MNSLKQITLLLLLVIFTSACSVYSISSETISGNYYPSKESASDVVYLDMIDVPHEVIGIVNVNAERRQRMDSIIDKMKYEAAILGGDAITDIQSDATGAWKKLPAQKVIGNGYVRANFSATVVAFK